MTFQSDTQQCLGMVLKRFELISVVFTVEAHSAVPPRAWGTFTPCEADIAHSKRFQSFLCHVNKGAKLRR